MIDDPEQISLDAIRSTEVQEIISRLPAGIIRSGTAVVFAAIVALLTISWFIEYPDTLPAKVIITTLAPPTTLVSRTAGNLVLLKGDKEAIEKGEMVSYIRTNTSPRDVLDLEKGVISHSENFKTIDAQMALGELEQDYAVLQKAYLDLNLFLETALYDVQIRQLRKQKVSYQKLHNMFISQRNLALQELALASQKFKMDSVLFTNSVTAMADFNRDKSVWLEQQRSFSNVETALISNEIQLNELDKQIRDLEIKKTETEQKFEVAVIIAEKALLAHIAKWKETYLFVAPHEGKVAYIGFKENEMFIDAGQPVFSVLPNNDTLIARAELPLYNSGKVEVGQRVNIKLENYPFAQYGTIRGLVGSISAIPNEDMYFVNIYLPNKLTTSQNQTLEFKQQLSGTTEIMTEDLRLLERFLYQFRSLLGSR